MIFFASNKKYMNIIFYSIEPILCKHIIRYVYKELFLLSNLLTELHWQSLIQIYQKKDMFPVHLLFRCEEDIHQSTAK